METIKKNWIGWLITLLIAILTSIITLAMTNKSRDEYDYKNKVDMLESKKLDVSAFNEYSKQNDLEHKEIVKKQEDQYNDMNKTLQLLLRQETTNTVNINWLIENEKRKNR